jgi:hypothetical protein
MTAADWRVTSPEPIMSLVPRIHSPCLIRFEFSAPTQGGRRGGNWVRAVSRSSNPALTRQITQPIPPSLL